MSIHWEPYIKGVRPAHPTDVEQLEKDWCVRLPEEYKHIAPRYHGMNPSPNVFDIGAGANVLTCLLTLTPTPGREVYAVARRYNLIKPYVPAGIFPFGITPGGENICFDYRDAPAGQPRVVLVTVEMEIYLISNSFREFLAGLHELSD